MQTNDFAIAFCSVPFMDCNSTNNSSTKGATLHDCNIVQSSCTYCVSRKFKFVTFSYSVWIKYHNQIKQNETKKIKMHRALLICKWKLRMKTFERIATQITHMCAIALTAPYVRYRNQSQKIVRSTCIIKASSFDSKIAAK